MKSLKKFAVTALITVSVASVAFAGTIPGGKSGTIVGGKSGTIVGGKSGTIVGGKSGTSVGGRTGIIPTHTDQRSRSNFQDELLSSLITYLILGW
jgi:hypothetical protein